MTTELFGVSAGQQMAAHDQLKADEGTALIRIHNANAAELETKNTQARLMMEMLQGSGGGDPGDAAGQQMSQAGSVVPGQTQALANRLNSAATMAMKAGLLQQAEGAAKAAAVLTKDAAEQHYAVSNAAWRDNEVAQAKLSRLNALAAGIKGAPDPVKAFNDAKMLWMGDPQNQGQPLPKIFEAYNPGLVDAVLSGTKEGLAKLKVDAEVENKASQEALRDAREKFMKERLKLSQDAAKAKQEAADLKAKAGKVVGTPSKDEQARALRLLKDTYKDVTVKGDLVLAADDLAGISKGIRAKNPGIDPSAADGMALEEVKKKFQPVAEAYEVLGMKVRNAQVEYRRQASAGAKAPRDLVPAGSREIGANYTLKNGKVGKWTGQGFELQGAP